MTTGVWTVLLDTSGPASLSASLNRGTTPTGDPIVRLYVQSGDFLGGKMDVDAMLVWGDVDPEYDPAVQSLEVNSDWTPFSTWTNVLLSPGDGEKTVHIKVRDLVGNIASTDATLTYTAGSVPVVTLLDAPHRERYGTVTGFNEIRLAWRSNHDFTQYLVGLVNNVNEAHDKAVAIVGGTNVGGTGTWIAGQRIATHFTTAQALTASPGDGAKIIKVFVKNAKGVWST